VLSGDPGQRFRLAGARQLGSRLFEPGRLQYPHRGGAPETLKRNSQYANAESGCLGDLSGMPAFARMNASASW
jgi:hypothetical protein